MKHIQFEDKLSVEIIIRYLVPLIKQQVSNGDINNKTNPNDLLEWIKSKYNEIYKSKNELLNQSDMTIEKLFNDAPKLPDNITIKILL